MSGQGILIVGASGTGKSGLALDLMSRGAMLVSDDRTDLIKQDGVLIASAPVRLRGKIEARGLGILAADDAGPTIVRYVVDLNHPADKRLPETQSTNILGVEIDLIFAQSTPNLGAAITQLLKGSRLY